MKLNENTKVILTVKQIKRLLKEYRLDQGILIPTYDEEQKEPEGWFEVTSPRTATLKRDIPEQCINAVAGPGNHDTEVARWVELLDFDKGLPIDVVKKFIRATGGDEDPDEMDELDMAEFVLWSLCCEIREQRREIEQNRDAFIEENGEEVYNDMMAHTRGNFFIGGY